MKLTTLIVTLFAAVPCSALALEAAQGGTTAASSPTITLAPVVGASSPTATSTSNASDYVDQCTKVMIVPNECCKKTREERMLSAECSNLVSPPWNSAAKKGVGHGNGKPGGPPAIPAGKPTLGF